MVENMKDSLVWGSVRLPQLNFKCFISYTLPWCHHVGDLISSCKCRINANTTVHLFVASLGVWNTCLKCCLRRHSLVPLWLLGNCYNSENIYTPTYLLARWGKKIYTPTYLLARWGKWSTLDLLVKAYNVSRMRVTFFSFSEELDYKFS